MVGRFYRGSKIMFSLSRFILFWQYDRSGFLRFFNLYDKSLPENGFQKTTTIACDRHLACEVRA
jgi:hypothetical protein